MREVTISFTMLTDADTEALDNLSFEMTAQMESLADLGYKLDGLKIELNDNKKLNGVNMFLKQFTKDNWDNWMIRREHENSEINKFVLELCPDKAYDDFTYNVVCEVINCYEKRVYQNVECSEAFYDSVDYYAKTTSDYDVENLLIHLNNHYNTFKKYEFEGRLNVAKTTIDKIALCRKLQIDYLVDQVHNFLDQKQSTTLKLYEIDTRKFSFKVFAKNKKEFRDLFEQAWAKQLTANFAEDSQEYFDQLVDDANVFVVQDGLVYRDHDVIGSGDVC